MTTKGEPGPEDAGCDYYHASTRELLKHATVHGWNEAFVLKTERGSAREPCGRLCEYPGAVCVTGRCVKIRESARDASAGAVNVFLVFGLAADYKD